jgi:hypothetical protein
MKKAIIGAVVGAIIYFVFETVMWMGGFHNDFSMYSPNQAAIMQNLNANLSQDGAYMMPSVDPAAPDAEAQNEKIMTEGVGKPWVMVFYHTKMKGMEPGFMVTGFLYMLLACFIVAFILHSGTFNTFGKRFTVSMGFSLFALLQCTFAQMNWWEFPWHFVKSTVIDLIFGWGIVSVWLASYVKVKPETV